MKKLLLSLICVIAAGQLFAQQPCENNTVCEKQTQCPKQVLYEKQAFRKPLSDISVGYGMLPTDFDFFYKFSDILHAVNVRYDGYLGRRFSLGGTLSYGWTNYNSVFSTEKYTALTALINARYNWLNTSRITLYSRFGFGLQVSSIDVYNNKDNTAMYGKGGVLAFQITPIGIELGQGIFRFYSEIGLGQTGCLELGLRIKL